MNNQNSSNQGSNALHLFADWIAPSTGRRSRRNSQNKEEPNSPQPNYSSMNFGINFNQFINSIDSSSEVKFQEKFLFGRSMQIWRKGRTKTVQIFLDQNMPTLLWVSSKTKAFLFDLTYTTVTHYDFDMEKASNIKDFIVLHYFEEELPIVFPGGNRNAQAKEFYQLFNNYTRFCKFYKNYPPYFSKIMKMYTMEEIKNSIQRKKISADILKVSQALGYSNKEANWKMLAETVNKNDKTELKESSEISKESINQYFKLLLCCEALKKVFQQYSQKQLDSYVSYLLPLMQKEQFRRFLAEEQRQDEQDINSIMQETKEYISFYDFCAFLLSEKENYAALAPPLNEQLPLNDYYCYSSHNTYLTGNQLTSDCKIERYIEDLEGGLKCVELDVHNDTDKHRPIITHAIKDKSLCKPIDFEETIEEISRFCKKHPDHYPIILSIENHAKEENRYKMFNYLNRNFDNALLLLTDPNQDLLTCKKLSQLRGKVIVKSDSKIIELQPFRKNNKAALEKNANQRPSFWLPVEENTPKFVTRAFEKRFYQFRENIIQSERRKGLFESAFPKGLYLPLAQMTKVTSMFKSESGVNNQESKGYECTSKTNEQARKIEQEKIIRYTKRSWLRIYPMATEFASSNYNPVPVLRIGAQIIALNTQTKDDYAWLMMSYFTAGRQHIPGRIGYVDKPLHLRTNSQKEISNKTISITILTPERVRVKFYGSERDNKLNQNGSLNFQVQDYLQGFVIFMINDKYKDCIPLRFMRKGYRVLIGKNQLFNDSGIRVLIHINIKEMQLATS